MLKKLSKNSEKTEIVKKKSIMYQLTFTDSYWIKELFKLSRVHELVKGIQNGQFFSIPPNGTASLNSMHISPWEVRYSNSDVFWYIL